MRVEWLWRAILPALFVVSAAQAGSVDGVAYTNFGNDLVRPIFPVGGKLALYNNKNDTAPRLTLRDKTVAGLEGDWRACVAKASDGWVRCNVDGERVGQARRLPVCRRGRGPGRMAVPVVAASRIRWQRRRRGRYHA
jgi:hypothetical protein